MKKVFENELEGYVQKFSNKDVILKLEGIVKEKIKMENVECNYNIRNGIFKIKDKTANINIDISSVYRIEISENNSMLVIYLDNGIDIRIEK